MKIIIRRRMFDESITPHFNNLLKLLHIPEEDWLKLDSVELIVKTAECYSYTGKFIFSNNQA